MRSNGVKRDIVYDGLNAMCGRHEEMDFVEYSIKGIVCPKHLFTHTNVVTNLNDFLSSVCHFVLSFIHVY